MNVGFEPTKRYTELEVKHLSEQDVNAYWEFRLTQRADEFTELCRLSVVFRSNFFQNRLYDVLSGRGLYDTEDYETFWGSKRPYGNKNIPASIAYNLGWDIDRILCYHRMPYFVEEEAIKIHKKLLDFIKDDWEHDNKMYFTGFEEGNAL